MQQGSNKFSFSLVLAILLCLFLAFPACSTHEKPNSNLPLYTPIRAADVSLLPKIWNAGRVFTNENNQQEDMLDGLLRKGYSFFRIRIWHHLADTLNAPSLEEARRLSQKIHQKGGKVWLSIHYSDSWADPSQQSIPAAWQNADSLSLLDSVYQYTQRICQTLSPDLVQIGNEINHGLLWPKGSFQNTAAMKALLAAGLKAAKSVNPSCIRMLHFAGYQGADYFFNQVSALDFDQIGLSYYPMWHGKSLDSLENALLALHQQTQKPVWIAETSYPFTLSWNDNTHNVIGSQDQLIPAYPASLDGQKNFLQALFKMLQKHPELPGYCYWGAELVSYPAYGSGWENQALWDFQGKMVPALYSE